MKILAFESSCDETSCAVIEDGRHILSEVISTQVPIHKKFGGVVPEIASRCHVESIQSRAFHKARWPGRCRAAPQASRMRAKAPHSAR